jgi:hypothetical protein
MILLGLSLATNTTRRMKRFFHPLLILFLLSDSGCKKEKGPFEIFGDWQWVSSTGGFTGKQVFTPASTNVSRTLSFGRDSLFVQCDNGKCSMPTKFTTRMERSYINGEKTLILTIRRRIYLTPSDTSFNTILSRYSIQEVSKTLRITQDGPDGFIELYQR